MIEWKCLSSCYSSCCSNLFDAPLNDQQNICNIFNKVTPKIPQNMIKRKYVHLTWANSVLLLPKVCTLFPHPHVELLIPVKTVLERMCEWSVLRSEKAPCWNCPIVPFKHTSVLPSCPGLNLATVQTGRQSWTLHLVVFWPELSGYSGSFLSRKMRP